MVRCSARSLKIWKTGTAYTFGRRRIDFIWMQDDKPRGAFVMTDVNTELSTLVTNTTVALSN